MDDIDPSLAPVTSVVGYAISTPPTTSNDELSGLDTETKNPPFKLEVELTFNGYLLPSTETYII